MTRQQEIRNPLLDGVLVPAVGADQLALGDLRLQQQVVQVAHQLVVGLQLLLRRGLLGQGRESELCRWLASSSSSFLPALFSCSCPSFPLISNSSLDSSLSLFSLFPLSSSTIYIP